MATFKVITLVCMALAFVEAERLHMKRETRSNICDPVYNNTNKIQCYCIKDSKDDSIIRSADCYPTIDGTTSDDPNWVDFNDLKSVSKLLFTNARGITLKYIPKNGLKHTTNLQALEVKYGNIETIEPFAFANLTLIKKMVLSDNQIKVLKPNAFAHHHSLEIISLDMNSIVEINRGVFIDLPALQKLYLTSNKITTIHDKAFMHLTNLRELEIDRNSLFSLNSETFSGLEKLDRLDISSNTLEVIGDNTFLPLKQLRVLNLEGNKIQMIDGKAFNGLKSLISLSLAHNALADIDNVKIFGGLRSLKSLSLKENQLRHLKPEVIAPLLQNLHANESSLDLEDNNFPCDCRLDWFIPLKNHTNSSQIKLALENLKCTPDADTREKWMKAAELEKTQETEETNPAAADYEYYDDTQLNGKLFYFDMRYLLNCTTKFDTLSTKTIDNTLKLDVKSTTNFIPTTFKTTTHNPQINNDKTVDVKADISDLKFASTTAKEITNTEEKYSKHGIYTTSRLATVSANPIQNKLFHDNDMASDEAKPDKIKAHRSIQDNIEETPEYNQNSANTNISCFFVLLITMYLRILCI